MHFVEMVLGFGIKLVSWVKKTTIYIHIGRERKREIESKKVSHFQVDDVETTCFLSRKPAPISI